MHFSGNFLENVLVVVVGGLVIKLLAYLCMGVRSGISMLARPERLFFPSWRGQLERWKEERHRHRSLPDNRTGALWTLAIAVVMAIFGYYAARHRSSIDERAAAEMAHQYVQRKYQKEINLLRHVRFSSAGDEQVEEEGDGKFTVRGWYAWDAHKAGTQQRWMCKLHSTDGGRSWNSDSIQKENSER